MKNCRSKSGPIDLLAWIYGQHENHELNHVHCFTCDFMSIFYVFTQFTHIEGQFQFMFSYQRETEGGKITPHGLLLLKCLGISWILQHVPKLSLTYNQQPALQIPLHVLLTSIKQCFVCCCVFCAYKAMHLREKCLNKLTWKQWLYGDKVFFPRCNCWAR